MSLHYLLDGYNIIHQVPQLCEGTLEERRSRLIAWLNVSTVTGSRRNQVTVVFDGNDQHFGGAVAGHARVIFTSGESADQYIKGVVEEAHDPKRYVVVSDDKEIRLYTRALGTAVVHVKEFAKDLYGIKQRNTTYRLNDTQVSSKYISLTKAKLINDEFAKIWNVK